MPTEILFLLTGLVAALFVLTYRVGWLHGKSENG